MNKFTASEIIGRNLLKSFLDQVQATNQQPTEDQFNPVDYYFTLQGKNAVAEIKVRDKKYLKYDSHLMEVSKLKALLKDKEEKNLDSAWYVNFFIDGDTTYCYMYSTDSVIKYGRKTSKLCPKTTAVTSAKVDKQVIEIPTYCAQKIKRVTNKWQKYE